MNKQQTALDWFIYQITENHMLAIDVISLAKEMEKQQIIDAYIEASENPALIIDDAEEYYNETFKK